MVHDAIAITRKYCIAIRFITVVDRSYKWYALSPLIYSVELHYPATQAAIAAAMTNRVQGCQAVKPPSDTKQELKVIRIADERKVEHTFLWSDSESYVVDNFKHQEKLQRRHGRRRDVTQYKDGDVEFHHKE